MPRKQDVGDGDGDPLGPELGVPLGPVVGELDGGPLGAPPLGVGLAVTGVAAALGSAEPPGPDVRAAPDALCAGTWPAGVLAVEDPAGAWFAAGVPVNAPETSSATRPALATTAALTATAAPARRRGFPCGWPGCPGPGGPV